MLFSLLLASLDLPAEALKICIVKLHPEMTHEKMRKIESRNLDHICLKLLWHDCIAEVNGSWMISTITNRWKAHQLIVCGKLKGMATWVFSTSHDNGRCSQFLFQLASNHNFTRVEPRNTALLYIHFYSPAYLSSIYWFWNYSFNIYPHVF